MYKSTCTAGGDVRTNIYYKIARYDAHRLSRMSKMSVHPVIIIVDLINSFIHSRPRFIVLHKKKGSGITAVQSSGLF